MYEQDALFDSVVVVTQCIAIKDSDKFMSEARTKKMKAVVEKYVLLLGKKDAKVVKKSTVQNQEAAI